MPTHQGQAFTQRAPIPAKPAWEKPWRAHHTKAPGRSYFRLRSRTHGSGQRGGEREKMDVREAAEAIRQVIVFARSLPHVTNNRRNVERWIQQRETRQAESGTSTTSSSRGHSPIPQLPKLLRIPQHSQCLPMEWTATAKPQNPLTTSHALICRPSQQ